MSSGRKEKGREERIQLFLIFSKKPRVVNYQAGLLMHFINVLSCQAALFHSKLLRKVNGQNRVRPQGALTTLTERAGARRTHRKSSPAEGQES